MTNNNAYNMKYKHNINYLIILIAITSISIISFIIFSPHFEQNKPKIIIDNEIYWNLKNKLDIRFTDDTGIKYYKVTYNDGNKKLILNQQILSGKDTNITISVIPPKFDMFYKGQNISLTIEVFDKSKWNYLNGNVQVKKVKLYIDTIKPIANIVKNTRYIKRGSTAVVVVKVKDENLEDAYISFNNKLKFKLIPFYKKDYFVSLIPWDINIERFKRVNLVAVDKAANKTITKVPLYTNSIKIKEDTINVSSSFIESTSSNVLEQSAEAIPLELDKRFIQQNRVLRKKNVQFLRDINFKYMDVSKINNFNIKPFKRLNGSATVAKFAERRYYVYKNKKIDEAWHLGIDWASVKKAPIRASNAGRVLFNEYLGIYGNTIIIDHGMGLSSLYGHISSSDVQPEDIVKENQKIGNTGSSGAAMGDHLHFGVLIQGIEVDPLEWMDKNWINTNIIKIINDAKIEIDNK